MLLITRWVLTVNLSSHTSDLLLLISIKILVRWVLAMNLRVLLSILALLSCLRGWARPWIIRGSSLLFIRVLTYFNLPWSQRILLLNSRSLRLYSVFYWLLLLLLLLFLSKSIDCFSKGCFSETILINILWIILLNFFLNALQSFDTPHTRLSSCISLQAVVLWSIFWLDSLCG